MSSQRIAVIGAGPSGAAAARTLARAGRQVTVFERAPHIGGRTYTYRKGDESLDTGAGFITNFYPRTLAFAEELGFKARIQELHRRTGLHRDDTLAALDITSTRSFLRFPFWACATSGGWRSGQAL